MDTETCEIVDDASFSERVLRRHEPIVVLFTLPDCLPCHILDERLPKLVAELPGGVRTVRCAVEASPWTRQRYGIARTPTLLLFHDGRPVATRAGLSPLPATRAWLTEALELTSRPPDGRRAPRRERDDARGDRARRGMRR